MRILVTGSRDWPDYPAVGAALVRAVEAWADLHPEVGCGVTNWVTVVHGACPTGADMFADDFCKHVTGWAVESHPADWNAHGRAAGFLRNAEMVDRGADVCLAFIGSCTSPRCSKREPHPSHGATHTADLAERRGIPTVRFHPTDSRPIQDGPLPPLTPSDASPLHN